jgi:hypothetical protein
MNERYKVTAGHRRRAALIYVRQSTMAQVECHRESTDRQYALVEQARRLGWAREQIAVIDDDLGLSGASTSHRNGFARMTAEVAMGRVGIVLGLEVSRLARNNADWYRLLDLCGMTDTLIGDADGVYHPGAFNDRLVLGSKAPCPKLSCTFCAPASRAGSATRRHAASCAALCRWAWSGATPTARSAFIPTKP